MRSVVLPRRGLVAARLSVLALCIAGTVAGQEPATTEDPAPVEARTGAAAGCAGGAIEDDGTVETGYGFVPSAVEGVYVQRFEPAEIEGGRLRQVCLCLIKSKGEPEADFEVVIYPAEDGLPGREPLVSIPAHAPVTARRWAEAGAFVAVDTGDVAVPDGPFFLGLRWNPSEQSFLFVCADRSADTPETPAFFFEDRARGWTSVFTTKDPMFRGHKALLVRAVGTGASAERQGAEEQPVAPAEGAESGAGQDGAPGAGTVPADGR